MNKINYILDGFGFINWADFKSSAFGFINIKIIEWAALLACAAELIHNAFGVSYAFVIAYVLLIIFEWITGVKASFKRGEKHSSRKLGRMLLKVAVYSLPLFILNTFQKEVQFPEILGHEIDPFIWLYWAVILVIIWQLLVSLLENLDELGFPFAKTLMKIINKRFYEHFHIDSDE